MPTSRLTKKEIGTTYENKYDVLTEVSTHTYNNKYTHSLKRVRRTHWGKWDKSNTTSVINAVKQT